MTSSNCAALILAHADPPQVRRLCRALADLDLFLHCDRKTSDATFRAMCVDLPPHVHLLRRRRTALFSWSLVAAELSGLQAALERSAAEYIIVMSGSCYPLLSAPELQAELDATRGQSRLGLVRLPHPRWNTRRNPDGGYWRLRRRFVVFRDQAVHFRGVALRTRKRSIPPELELYAGAQWKIYSRAHARRLLEVCNERPDLIRFFRHSYVPDESFVPTLLKSPRLVGAISDQVIPVLPWYIEWPPHSSIHPNWLTVRSFEAARRASRPASPQRSGAGDTPTARALFARKVHSSQSELVTLIDRELRQ